jgi:uncharacterized membrane protein YqjE
MAEKPPASPGLRDALARITSTTVALVHTRLSLASVEFAEERERIKESLTLFVAGAVCAMFALLSASLFVVAYFWDSYRFTAIAGVTLFYVLGAAYAWWKMGEVRRSAPSPFAATLAELEKDRARFTGSPLP